MTFEVPVDLGQSALSAFRADLAVSGDGRTPADHRLLALAALLRQAAIEPGSHAAVIQLSDAAALAAGVAGPRRVTVGLYGDEPGAESDLDLFRVVAECAGDFGRRHLQIHILQSVAALSPAGGITAGRAHLRCITVLMHMGELDRVELALNPFLPLLHELPPAFRELEIRAMLTRSAVLRMRGNLPAA